VIDLEAKFVHAKKTAEKMKQVVTQTLCTVAAAISATSKQMLTSIHFVSRTKLPMQIKAKKNNNELINPPTIVNGGEEASFGAQISRADSVMKNKIADNKALFLEFGCSNPIMYY